MDVLNLGDFFTVAGCTEVVSAADEQILIFRAMRSVAGRAHPFGEGVVVLVTPRPQALEVVTHCAEVAPRCRNPERLCGIRGIMADRAASACYRVVRARLKERLLLR